MNICKILKESRNIAVVGFSADRFKTSNKITRLLADAGYVVAGINPNIEESEIDGIPVYKTLKEIPFQIDILDVFRKPEFMVDLAREALLVKPKVFWMQLGIENSEASEILENAGITVIMDKCIAIELSNCE